jgi:protein gp37
VAEIVRKPDGSIADHRWTGKIIEVPEKLLEPLRWKKPQRIFVNSTSDLFHDGVSDEFIEQVFAVMALAHWHTFLILTKRTARMRRFFEGFEEDGVFHEGCRDALIEGQTQSLYAKLHPEDKSEISMWLAVNMPLPNVWLGASIEDQPRFDERHQDLLATPARHRFISYEPALGPVNFWPALFVGPEGGWEHSYTPRNMIDQIIVGGESGPGARDFHLEHATATVDICHRSGTAAFVKQLGAAPMLGGQRLKLIDKKGGDMAEWPENLRVREMP